MWSIFTPALIIQQETAMSVDIRGQERRHFKDSIPESSASIEMRVYSIRPRRVGGQQRDHFPQADSVRMHSLNERMMTICPPEPAFPPIAVSMIHALQLKFVCDRIASYEMHGAGAMVLV